MTIREIVGQGFYYARTCRSLWLFGFFVGIASGGSNGGSGGGSNGGGAGAVAGMAAGGLEGFPGSAFTLIIAAILLVIVAGFVMRFLSEGALIEGVVRARRGAAMSTREGFRAGWAHWGVLLRIGLLYLAATIASGVLLGAPCVLAFRAWGPLGAALAGIPALVIAVPWLVTLSLVQAFAMRIAVLDNRRALDAIGKARLFLHGRLILGLKLLVATFVGTIGITLLSVVIIGPVVLVLATLAAVVPVLPLIAVALLVLLPAGCVLTAMLGTYRSSIWTIGYMTQVES